MKLLVSSVSLLLLAAVPPAQAQSNNFCASPQEITAGSWTFDTTSATLDGPSAGCGFGGDTADVWFRYTASQAGNVSISGTPGNGISTFAITILNGCNGAETLCIGDVSSEPAVFFSAAAGQQFLIRVATYADYEERGEGTLDIEELGLLPGDTCSDPLPAFVGSSINQWSNQFAATETTNSGCASAGEWDVWYDYVAQINGNAEIHTLGTSADTVLSVFPSCGANPIACSDNLFINGTVAASRVCIPVAAGEHYLIRLATKFSRGSGLFTINEWTPPVNETCATAISVDAGSTAWNSVGARSTGPASACSLIATERTVWYRYTPLATGVAVIGTCGSSGDSVVSVFAAPCTGGEVDCNDNGCGDDARVVVPTIAGTPLLIRVHSNYFTGATAGTLTITQASPLVNDNCSGAIPVVPGVNAFNLEFATSNFALPESSTCSGSHQCYSDVWYKFTPQATGSIQLDTCTPSEAAPDILNTVLSVWAGCSSAAPIACNDDSDTCLLASGSLGTGLKSRLTTGVSAGATYYIRVGKYERDTPGTVGRLNFTFTPAGCAADFDHSGSLSVQDIFDFLTAWFNGSPSADFNHAGGLSVQDIFDFLSAWFSGC